MAPSLGAIFMFDALFFPPRLVIARYFNNLLELLVGWTLPVNTVHLLVILLVTELAAAADSQESRGIQASVR